MPKGADNVTLILDAARELFLRNGFGSTSMDAVARTAGVSKATVYAHYDSKDALFAATVAREGARQTLDLGAHFADDNVDDVLRKFGREVAELLLSEPVVAMRRIVASEAGRDPEVGRLFYASGPANLIASLATYLGQAMDRGHLRRESPRLAATQFIQIIVGDLQLRALIGQPEPDRTVHDAVVASGVDVFLRGYAADPLT